MMAAKQVAGYTVNIPDPLRQGDLERFHLFMEIYEEAALDNARAHVPEMLRGMVPRAFVVAGAIQRGLIAKAAAAAGWIDGLEPSEVENLPPGVVRALAEAIWEPVARAQQIPKG